VDLVYAPLHHALTHEIATNGTIVSEWPNDRSARRPGQPISRRVTG
jgi:DNA processing protein